MEDFIINHYDKWLHFLISGTLTVWLIFLPKKTYIKIIGFGVCLAIAFSKEFIIDLWLDKGTFEWLDIIYTTIIPVIGLIVSLILRKK